VRHYDRFFFSSLTRISELEDEPFAVAMIDRERWADGDYVVVEVVTRSADRRLELPNGRAIELAEGDLVVGALGVRRATLEATGDWRATGRDGYMEVLTGGGLLGRMTSVSLVLGPFTRVRYRGHVLREGSKVKMESFVKAPVEATPFQVPTVLIVGTSMSAGKTTAARIAIRRLKAMGQRVLGVKVTGAGRYRDVLTMSDAGADAILDFVDVGLPSTVCPEPLFRERLEILLSKMARARADVAVVEVGASPLEPYNGAAAVEELEEHVRCTILCASDPYAVVGVTSAFDRRPDLVTGITSNTDAGVELVEKLSGLRCLNIRDKAALPELDRLLASTLGGPTP